MNELGTVCTKCRRTHAFGERVWCTETDCPFDRHNGMNMRLVVPSHPIEFVKSEIHMDVNQKQVGGAHYKSGYQHWDLVLTHEMHYLIACATKYVTRQKNNKFEDLQKAQHYLEKMIDAAKAKQVDIGCRFFPELAPEIELYARENNLSFREYEILHQIIIATDPEELETAIEMIEELLKLTPGNF